MKLLDELAARQRFGMKPGLDAMRTACAALGSPERGLRGVIHVAGTNGKGAVCAMLDACLRASGYHVGRYTSPHLVAINERFFLDGTPVSDATLDSCCRTLAVTPTPSPTQSCCRTLAVPPTPSPTQSCCRTLAVFPPTTYFEYLTLVAFILYARANPDFTVLETGLGGRLDATNVCTPALTVITRIGLDHCDWLGGTVEKIAAEKAGIVKPGVPIILGANLPAVKSVVASRARELGAPFYYAPDLATPAEIPPDFSLAGSFNRENALTALASLKVLAAGDARGLAQVVWPGRFQRIGRCIVDGAHNPPAAKALAEALADAGFGPKSLNLVCGFCGDKDVAEVLSLLAPFIAHGFAVKTNNPRSLTAAETAQKLQAAGIPATPCDSLSEALSKSSPPSAPKSCPPSAPKSCCCTLAVSPSPSTTTTLIAGSLFLAGEALVALGAAPYPAAPRFDAAERLKV